MLRLEALGLGGVTLGSGKLLGWKGEALGLGGGRVRAGRDTIVMGGKALGVGRCSGVGRRKLLGWEIEALGLREALRLGGGSSGVGRKC